MHTVTSLDTTPIAFDRTGDGPPLIYVGGAFNDRSAGMALATLLAPHFTVFSYDRRGRGASGDTAPYAVRREVEDLEAIIAEAGGSASVYGISSGAALALEAAANGLAITKLAIYEPPFNADDDTLRQRARDYTTKLTELLSADRRGDAVELFMTMVGMPAETVGQMRGAPMWPALEAMAPTLAYDAAVMGNVEWGGCLPTDRVAAVKTPTLVLSGGASPAWMRETAQRVADTLPHGQHRCLQGQTHDVAPPALAAALQDFLTAP